MAVDWFLSLFAVYDGWVWWIWLVVLLCWGWFVGYLCCGVVYAGYCVVGVIALIGLNLFAWMTCCGLLGVWLLGTCVCGFVITL